MITKLVIVEGIIGSGKSTLARFITRQLLLNRIPVAYVSEWETPHPTNVIRLPHEPPQWDTFDPVETARRSVEKWQSFVGEVERRTHAHVLDGHLLHWDFTALLLGTSDSEFLNRYARAMFDIVRKVDAVVIHLYQADPGAALRRIAAIRGEPWLRQQITAKLESPYCRAKGLEGFAGWLELYRNIRARTADLLGSADLRVLSIDTTAGRWRVYNRQVVRFLELRYTFDWRFHARMWTQLLQENAALARAVLHRRIGRRSGAPLS